MILTELKLPLMMTSRWKSLFNPPLMSCPTLLVLMVQTTIQWEVVLAKPSVHSQNDRRRCNNYFYNVKQNIKIPKEAVNNNAIRGTARIYCVNKNASVIG
jgi:hypothetical protein